MSTKLQHNQPLPPVRLLDREGAPISLNTGKRTLLSFFRDTNCPFCNARLFMLTHRYKEYSTAGLDVVAFFSATHEQVDEFLRIRPRPFRVIADILVDEHGRVVEAHSGQDAGDHMPFERIERFIGLGAH